MLGGGPAQHTHLRALAERNDTRCPLIGRAGDDMLVLWQSLSKRCCRPTDDVVLPALPRKSIEQLMLVMLRVGTA